MILKASQRAGARELAAHLLNGEMNEHVTVHEVRGFISEDLTEALEEAYAVSRGTRCKQFLFSLSLNPPETEHVPIEDFEAAIAEIERGLSLSGQPRAIVFHEKKGRRHCHVVWSRIQEAQMKAVNMSHFKFKLKDMSRELYRKHGWEMPKGMRKPNDRLELNFMHKEWQQAERLKENPKEMKQLLKGCWERSDDRKSFAKALEEYGFFLAHGDRRGYVALDIKGEAYSLSRWLGVKTREMKDRLGDRKTLPDAATAKTYVDERLTEKLEQHINELKQKANEKRTPLMRELKDLIGRHRLERQKLTGRLDTRWQNETRQRSSRLANGMRGIWERITGKYAELRNQNEREAKAGRKRDRAEMHKLVIAQLDERRDMQRALAFFRREHRAELLELRRTIAQYMSTATEPPRQDQPAAARKPQGIAVLAAQLAKVEAQIEALSGNIEALQASLDNAMLSEDMRARIRAMLEKALGKLPSSQRQDSRFLGEKARNEEAERQRLQEQFFRLLHQQEELQRKYKGEQARLAGNALLYGMVMEMPYKLNGVPLYTVSVRTPPKNLLDEKTFTRKLRQQHIPELRKATLNHRITEGMRKPEFAARDLRTGTLQVKELLARSAPKSTDSPVRNKVSIIRRRHLRDPK